MNLFKNILSAEESLFINTMALDYDFLPPKLKYREDQQEYLANCIKPLFQKRTGKNVLISGAPGIGKTAACKFVLRDLESETKEIIPLYVNCWKKDTAHKVAVEICNQIGYKWVMNKKTDEIIQEITKILNKKATVIVLDEVDKLESEQIIYQLVEDLNYKCIFMITNEKDWLAKLDQRVRSRLVPSLIEFQAYTHTETEGILKQRLDYAFVPNIWEQEAFDKVAGKTAELKDIRTGMFLLRETGTIAEGKASRKITTEHAEGAIEKLESFKIRKSTDLTDEEKEVLTLIKEHTGKTSKEIYEIFNMDNNRSYRTFHRRIKALEEAGIIEIKEEHIENGGRISVLKIIKKE
ncbi:MAG: AAA family ATPase [archaeon]